YSDFDQRIALVLPTIKASTQGTDALNAKAAHGQRDLGAGGLARAGAIKNNVPVPRDFRVAGDQVIRAELDRTRQNSGVRQNVERVAQVDDVEIVSTIHHGFQFCGFNAQCPNLAQKLLLSHQAANQKPNRHQDDQHDCRTIEPVQYRLIATNGIAEESSN